MPVTSLRELVIAFAAMGVVALICRWVFSPVRRPAPPPVAPADFGLLVPVAVARSAEDAVMLRDHLVSEGVRASVGPGHEVLVFRHDLDRARALVAS